MSELILGLQLLKYRYRSEYPYIIDCIDTYRSTMVQRLILYVQYKVFNWNLFCDLIAVKISKQLECD